MNETAIEYLGEVIIIEEWGFGYTTFRACGRRCETMNEAKWIVENVVGRRCMYGYDKYDNYDPVKIVFENGTLKGIIV